PPRLFTPSAQARPLRRSGPRLSLSVHLPRRNSRPLFPPSGLPLDVCFGSLADIDTSIPNVRFWPGSRHRDAPPHRGARRRELPDPPTRFSRSREKARSSLHLTC